jgi:hypothetical protein
MGMEEKVGQKSLLSTDSVFPSENNFVPSSKLIHVKALLGNSA